MSDGQEGITRCSTKASPLAFTPSRRDSSNNQTLNLNPFTMATDPTAAGPVTVPAAAYQPLPNPITVVGPQFCAQYPVDLVIVKKVMTISDGNFAVTDVNGSVIFKVKGTLLSLRDHRVLLDAAGKPIVSLQSKVPSIISLFFLRIGTFFSAKYVTV